MRYNYAYRKIERQNLSAEHSPTRDVRKIQRYLNGKIIIAVFYSNKHS